MRLCVEWTGNEQTTMCMVKPLVSPAPPAKRSVLYHMHAETERKAWVQKRPLRQNVWEPVTEALFPHLKRSARFIDELYAQ